MSKDHKHQQFILIAFSLVICIGLFVSASLLLYLSDNQMAILQEIWSHFKALSLIAAGYVFGKKSE